MNEQKNVDGPFEDVGFLMKQAYAAYKVEKQTSQQEHNEAISKLKGTISSLNGRIWSLNATVSSLKETISKLEHQIGSQGKQEMPSTVTCVCSCSEKRKLLDSLTEEREKNEEKDQEIKKLKRLLASKDSELKRRRVEDVGASLSGEGEVLVPETQVWIKPEPKIEPGLMMVPETYFDDPMFEPPVRPLPSPSDRKIDPPPPVVALRAASPPNRLRLNRNRMKEVLSPILIQISDDDEEKAKNIKVEVPDPSQTFCDLNDLDATYVPTAIRRQIYEQGRIPSPLKERNSPASSQCSPNLLCHDSFSSPVHQAATTSKENQQVKVEPQDDLMDETFVSSQQLADIGHLKTACAIRPPANKDPPKKGEPNYVYKNDPVRSKDERAKLKGYACKECEEFYADLSEAERREKIHACSRHRAKFVPRPHTPIDDFWSISIPNTEECIKRGHMQISTNSPKRPKRRRPLC